MQRDDVALEVFLALLRERAVRADTVQEVAERLARDAYTAADTFLAHAGKPSRYKPKEIVPEQ
jgi:hypothetical protein